MTIIVHDDGFYTATTNNADNLQYAHGFFFHHSTLALVHDEAVAEGDDAAESETDGGVVDAYCFGREKATIVAMAVQPTMMLPTTFLWAFVTCQSLPRSMFSSFSKSKGSTPLSMNDDEFVSMIQTQYAPFLPQTTPMVLKSRAISRQRLQL